MKFVIYFILLLLLHSQVLGQWKDWADDYSNNGNYITYVLNLLLIYWLIYLLVYLIVYLLIYLLVHSVINSFIHSLALIGVLEYNKIDKMSRNASRRLSSSDINQYALNTDLTVLYDPPTGFHSPTALGVYVEASNRDAKIYYELDGTALIR